MGEDSEQTHHTWDQVKKHMVGYRLVVTPETPYGKKQYISIHIGHHALAWERESNPLNRWPGPVYYRRACLAKGNPISLSFNFRYMSLAQQSRDSNSSIVYPELEKGTIPKVGTGKATSVYEHRHMLMMRMFSGEECRHFTLLSFGGLKFDEPILVMTSEAARSLTPLVLFIKYLRRLFVAYSAVWYEVLTQVAKQVDFSVRRLLPDQTILGSQFNRLIFFADD